MPTRVIVRTWLERPRVPLIMCMAACSSTEQRPCRDLRHSECIVDTREHHVCVSACTTDEDCPVGSRCPETADPYRECRVPAESVSDRYSLFTAFGVDKLPAQLIGEKGSRVIDWNAPEETTLVVCALFHCRPVVASPSDIDTIINFDRCVVARAAWTGTEGQFNPRDTDVIYPLEDEQPGDECTRTLAYQPVETLLAGCWAYDDWSLIAASELLSLAPTEVHDYRNNLARGVHGHCASDDAGRSCPLDNGRFGTCIELDGATPSCRPRCLSHEDCRAHCSDDTQHSYCSNGGGPSAVLGTCGPCGI